MAEVQLSNGSIALVSDEDYEAVSAYRWGLSNGYAKTNIKKADGRFTLLSMHRLILGLTAGDGKLGDHINSITLDNRRENLRVCTRAENCRNQQKSKANTSGFKGVHWRSDSNRWVAKIKHNGKIVHLGSFRSLQSGYEAYCKAAKELHGEFARTE